MTSGNHEHVVVVVVARGVGDRLRVGRPGGEQIHLVAGREKALALRRQVPEHELADTRAGRDVDEPLPVRRHGRVAVLLRLGGDRAGRDTTEAAFVEMVDTRSRVADEHEAAAVRVERELGVERIVGGREAEQRLFGIRRLAGRQGADALRSSRRRVQLGQEDGLGLAIAPLEAQAGAVGREARVPLVLVDRRADVAGDRITTDPAERARERPGRRRLGRRGLGRGPAADRQAEGQDHSARNERQGQGSRAPRRASLSHAHSVSLSLRLISS